MKFRDLFNADAVNGMIDAIPWTGIAGLGGVFASASVVAATNNPLIAAGGCALVGLAGAWGTAALVNNTISPFTKMKNDMQTPRAYTDYIPPSLMVSTGFAVGALAPLVKFL